MRKAVLIFTFTLFALVSCQKGSDVEDSSFELKTLKELGVDVSGAKFISSSVVVTSENPSRTFAEAYCTLKGSQYTFYIISQIYGDEGIGQELLTSFSLPYESHESTSVDVGYGEKETVNFVGLQPNLGLYYNGTVYLPISDRYCEPIPEGTTYLSGSLAEKYDNLRMVISSSNGIKTFPVEAISDDGLLAPEFNGGVLYNGTGYSSSGETLFTFGSDINRMFFKPSDTGCILVDWNPISSDEYFAVRFDTGSTKVQEGIVTCDSRLISIKDNAVVWYTQNDVAAAICEKGISLASNDRIESVTSVSKQNGIFKYKVSGTQYSGAKLDFTIALDINSHTVTIE